MITRKLIFKGAVVTVSRGADNLWRDKDGTVYGFVDNASSVDDVTRCGVWPVTLPKDSELNSFCKNHDYAYSSPAYQAFNTRKEADAELERQFAQAGYPLVGRVFKFFSRIIGSRYWENKNTNN